MVACAVARDKRIDYPAERVRKRGTSWVEDREMIKTTRAAGRRFSAPALPCVEAGVVVVAAGRYECHVGTVALDQLEAEHTVVKGQSAIEVGDFEMNMSNPRAGGDRFRDWGGLEMYGH